MNVRWLWVGLGGFAGAVARYWLGSWFAGRWSSELPWGTLVINLSGCFALGLLAALTARGGLSPEVRLGVMTGFLGAYTTFSTWSLETWRLLEGGARLAAIGNSLGSLTLGLVATWLGLGCGKLL